MVERHVLPMLFAAMVVSLGACRTAPRGYGPPTRTVPRNVLAGHDVFASVDHVYDRNNNLVPGAVAVQFIDARTQASIYRVYAEPEQRTAAGSDAWGILYSYPSFYLNSGWGYATGSCPVFVTRHFTASGSGTRMLVEYLAAPATGYRVYLLNETLFSDRVEIWPFGATTPLVALDKPDYYTEITIRADGSLYATPQAPIPANLLAFVNACVLEANDAGVTP